MTKQKSENLDVEKNVGNESEISGSYNAALYPKDCQVENGTHEHLKILQGFILKYDREVISLSEELDARNRELLQRCESYRKLEKENSLLRASLEAIRRSLHIDQELIFLGDVEPEGIVASRKDLFVSDYQVAILGSESSAISGDGGASISENNSVSASDVDGISISRHGSASISDDRGISISANDGTSTSKNEGISISRDEGCSMSLHDGVSISRHRGVSESGNRGVSIAGLGGICRAGKHGVLVSRYLDPEIMEVRILCAHVGENGIEPNKYYTIESGAFVEVDDPNKTKIEFEPLDSIALNRVTLKKEKVRNE